MKTALTLGATALLTTACMQGQPAHNAYGYGVKAHPAASAPSVYRLAPGQMAPTFHGQAHAPANLQGPQGPTTISAAAPYGAAHAARGSAPRLRGVKPPKGYVYGDLGGVVYEVGEDIYGIQGRLGYQSEKDLFFGFKPGAEVEGSFGISDESEPVAVSTDQGIVTADGDVGVDYRVAGFARLKRNWTPRFSTHSRIGYHSTEVDVDVDGFDLFDSENADGVAYGSGLEYAVTPNSALRLDYTVYDVSGGNFDSLAAAYQLRF